LKAFFFIFSMAFLSQFSFAQSSENAFVHEFKIHNTYVIKNWLADSFPNRQVSQMFEYNIAHQFRGGQYWHQSYKYPQAGLSVFCSRFGNDNELGWGFGLVPNLTFNTLVQKKWNVKVSLGMGLAYFNKPYDSISNPNNILIGSRITNMSYAQLYVQRGITPHLFFTFGLSTIHCSNGHYQIPNVGLNAPGIVLGIKYYPNRDFYKTIPDTIPEANKGIRFNLRLGVGVQEFAQTITPIGTPKYAVYTAAAYLSKQVGRFSNLHLGLSLRYYNGFTHLLEMEGDNENVKLKSSIGSLMLGHEFLMGRFSFLTQAAIDFYFPIYARYAVFMDEKTNFHTFLARVISTKLGVQYYLYDTKKRHSNNIYLGCYVNAHFGTADFIETGIGYVF